MRKKTQKPPTIQDLNPELSPEELEEAEANLLAYVDVVWRIYKRAETINESGGNIRVKNIGSANLNNVRVRWTAFGT
jgi:hypothetical protein